MLIINDKPWTLSFYPSDTHFIIKVVFLYLFLPLLISCDENQKSKTNNSTDGFINTDQHIFTIQSGTIVLLYKDQKRIALATAEKDSAEIREMILGSIYEPNKNLFTYCLGYEREAFGDTYTKALLSKSDSIVEKVQLYELNNLEHIILKTMQDIADSSIYPFEGRYTIGFFEDVGCIMCGCDNFTMLGNTFNEVYNDSTKLKVVLAHEINHNFFETAKQDDRDKNTVLYNSIDEGFANFFSMQVLNISKLTAFNMSEDDYQWLLEHESELKEKFCEVMFSTNEEDWDPYSEKIPDRILEGSPGDIGYFIGFRIIESWLAKNESRNWQDVYSVPVKNILKESTYCR